MYDPENKNNYASIQEGFTAQYAGNPPWDIGKP